MPIKTAKDAAKLISKILDPYVVFSVVVAIIAYHESPILGVWVKWTMVALLSAYLFPLVYMGARIYVVTHTTGSEASLRSFFREQPTEMALLWRVSLACLVQPYYISSATHLA